MKLDGKVAIVTGAGKGIGRGIALCLAREGADVAVNAFHEESAKAVSEQIKALGRQSVALEADVTNNAQVKRIVKETLDAFGRIDILVNNFGGHTDTFYTRLDPTFVDQEEQEWDDDYRINLKSQVLMCMEIVPHMISQESGKIINISSTAARATNPAQMTYGVFKAGSLHFTRTLAAELASYNINVNDVCPGGTAHTEMGRRFATGQAESFAKAAIRDDPDALKGLTPLEYYEQRVQSNFQKTDEELALLDLRVREKTPEDIGHAVVFFASEESRNISGQSLSVGRIGE